MKRLHAVRTWFGAAVLAGLILTATPAFAQDGVGKNPDLAETVKIIVSGEVVMDYIYRSREMTAYTESFSNPGPAAVGAPDTSESENTVEGHIAVRFDVEMSSSASITVEIGTRRVDDAQINELADEAAADPVLREAALKLAELLSPNISAEIGISTWEFNPHGHGGSMFSPRNSQTFTRNIDSMSPDFAGIAELNDQRLVEAGYPDELDPVGGVVTYEVNGTSLNVVLLPAVIEGGAANQDESFYALDGTIQLDDAGSQVGAIFAVSAVNNNVPAVAPNDPGIGDTSIFTVGGGGVINNLFVGGLQIFGEAYFQFGDAGENQAGESWDANGFAAQAGIEYHHLLGNPIPIWAGFKMTLFSGDDDDPFAVNQDTDVDRFASYENVEDLLIIESMYYGFDVDSNYTAYKIYAGVNLSLMSENDLEITTIVGITEMTEEIHYGAVSTVSTEDKLGNEVDVKLSWSVTKQVIFDVMFGYLFGSDVLEESMNAVVAPATLSEADDSALLWVLGTRVKF